MNTPAGPADPPRIGLTTYRERAAWGVWDEPADLLPVTYADAIAGAGGVPVLLPPITVGDVTLAARTVLDGVDGVVLSGGADVDPSRYGASRSAHTGAARPDRDSWELALTHEVLARDLPLLAVCRGMQVLAVALGARLIQHLPDRVGTDVHCPTVGVHGRHRVRLETGSRLAGILGGMIDAPTYHHQGVEMLPAELRATGWADDDTIEAIEVTGKRWALGVQWHPEVADGAPLFEAFVAASRPTVRNGAFPSEKRPVSDSSALGGRS